MSWVPACTFHSKSCKIPGGPGKTIFHVANAYTRTAQFEGLPAEASYRLQKVRGMVLGMIR
jgi:hypothetical protein